jgi:propanol-preferring alcohol dehydrogenase
VFVQQLSKIGVGLQWTERPALLPARDQILIQVSACGVCRTDLHIADGELRPRRLPIVPGHEIVGTIVAHGADAHRWALGTRVGVPWLAGSCGRCDYCRSGTENLCADARFTGFDADGGFAEMVLADPAYCVEVPALYNDIEAAPLLCAGIIGYRALHMAGDPRALGLYGFGAAAHILCQVAANQGREVYAFTRPGDRGAQQLALDCGARWAGDSTAAAPLSSCNWPQGQKLQPGPNSGHCDRLTRR